MSAASSALSFSYILRALTAAGAFGACLLAAVVWGQTPAADGEKPIAGPRQAAATAGAVPTARELLGPTAVAPLAEQPPAKIIIDPPLPDQLAKGVVVIQFRTENLRMSPVIGRAALAVSPRIGHLHVTLDDGPWLWAHFSDQELIVADLPPGPHKIRIELVNANHETLAQDVVKFEVPRRSLTQPEPKSGGKPLAEQPPAKIILDPPQPDLLAKGVVYIRYRTENLQIVPVFGPAALAVSPRIGHLRVTVDDAPWHWVNANGQPLDVAYLPPGPHRILIELVNANGEPLAQEVVKFEVPQRAATPAHHTGNGHVKVTQLSQRDIIEKLDGKAASATVVEVTFEPGQTDAPHRHTGPVFGYVLEGEYEHAIDDEPVKKYKAGDTFYEPSGSVHRVARNPSGKTRTRLLAVVLHSRETKETTAPEAKK